jgi:hypothetical protein
VLAELGTSTETGAAASRGHESVCWMRSSSGPRISNSLPSSGSMGSPGRENHNSTNHRRKVVRRWSFGRLIFLLEWLRRSQQFALIFPTLAFQLAQQYPKFRPPLIHLLQSNPDITYQSLQDQMEKFLVELLRSTDISTVIIIDALDECNDEDPGWESLFWNFPRSNSSSPADQKSIL